MRVSRFSLCLGVCCVLSSGPSIVLSQPLYFHYQTSAARALGMGGAFTAVQDYHASLAWNPASLVLAKERSDSWNDDFVGLNIDLVSGAVGLLGAAIEAAASDEDEPVDLRVLGVLLYSIRGITILSSDDLLLSVNLHEDVLDHPRTMENVFDNALQTAFISYGIGREFAIGASVSYVQIARTDGRRTGVGYTFGWQYNSLIVPGLYYGMAYHGFSDAVRDARSGVERIFPGTINAGASYAMADRYVLSLDVRNILSVRHPYFCEVHAGFEQTLLGDFAIREGLYFVNNNVRRPTVSFGLGYTVPVDDPWTEDQFDAGLGFVVNNNGPQPRYDLLLTLRFRAGF